MTTTTRTDQAPARTPLATLFKPRPGYSQHPLKAWPYTWKSLGWFATAFVAMTTVWTIVGKMVVNWFEPSAIGQAEADVNFWLEDNRTETLNTVAEILSIPSDTPVKIGLMAAMIVVFPLVLRRWHDWAFIVGALVLEVCVYGAASSIVGRARPDVERLTTAPTQSFPSGHMAASITFYIGLVIIVHWNTNNQLWRKLAIAVGVLIPAGMFMTRLYLGMHYLSDMIGGILLGLTSLVVAFNIAQDGLAQTNDDETRFQAPQVESLDLTPDLTPNEQGLATK